MNPARAHASDGLGYCVLGAINPCLLRKTRWAVRPRSLFSDVPSHNAVQQELTMKLNVFNLKQALIAISVSLGALVYPAESKPGIKAFAFEVGRQTGSFYCKGIPMESAMEKGMMAAALEMDMPIAQVDSMDLESDKAAAALIDGIFDIAIDTCPKRAKTIFREFANLGN